MTFCDALTAVLAILSAACGLVAVAAMIEQRGKADKAVDKLDGEWVIDGGYAGEPPPDAPPPPDNDLGSLLEEILEVARPGWIPIGFAIAGVVFAGAAGVLAFYC